MPSCTPNDQSSYPYTNQVPHPFLGMSKDGIYSFSLPTAPPQYPTPKMSDKIRPQTTGGTTLYEHELDDLHARQETRPQDYDEAYHRWRRGVENEAPRRPPERSKLAALFATCCCGSVWGIVAWVLGLIILVAAFTALIAKVVVCCRERTAKSANCSNSLRTHPYLSSQIPRPLPSRSPSHQAPPSAPQLQPLLQAGCLP